VTDCAANIVASLNHTDFVSDREIFKAYKRCPKLPKRFNRIEKLRYGHLKGRALFAMLLSFYLNLIEFCETEGIHFPVHEEILRKL